MRTMMPLPRDSKEDFAVLGREAFSRFVRFAVESNPTWRGWVACVDIETGEYEVAQTGLEASERLYARLPNAQIWAERVGSPTLYRHGAPAGITRPRLSL